MSDYISLLSLGAIVLDDKTQSRDRTEPEVVEQYAEAWRNKAEFPPVDLFAEDNLVYYIGDDIYRCQGALAAGRSSIIAIVHGGNEHAAKVFACGANKNHGLYRSNADKRNAVARMLECEPTWSNRMIAEHVGVDDKTVKSVRNVLVSGVELPHLNERVGTDGRIYKVLQQKVSTAVKPQLNEEPAKTAEPPKISGGTSFAPAEIESAAYVGPDINALASAYKQAVSDLNRMARELKAAASEEKTGAYLVDSIVRITMGIDSLKASIRIDFGRLGLARVFSVASSTDGDRAERRGHTGIHPYPPAVGVVLCRSTGQCGRLCDRRRHPRCQYYPRDLGASARDTGGAILARWAAPSQDGCRDRNGRLGLPDPAHGGPVMTKTETKGTVLVKHSLKQLKLPTMRGECEKVAARIAQENQPSRHQAKNVPLAMSNPRPPWPPPLKKTFIQAVVMKN